MENRPPVDRSLLPPILIGVAALLGILFVVLVSRLNTARSTDELEPTATIFKFVFLGTEPGISTPLTEETATVPADSLPTDFPATNVSESTSEVPPFLITPRSPSAPSVTAIVIPTNNTQQSVTRTPSSPATLTPTSASGPPLNPGTYDDTDARLFYSGNWINQTDVSAAYQGTLHVSATLSAPGNSATFRFIGEELRLFYQSGTSLGVMLITIDGSKQYQLNQAESGSEWVSEKYTRGTHSVTLAHLSGGSINLDYIIVPDIVVTATPSITPSPTRTPP